MPNLGNNLRADLYTKLLPAILEEDLGTGVNSFIHFWGDPMRWGDDALWGELGLLPVLKNLFYAIEKEETADLVEIDGITDLVDPDRCPIQFLDAMARSLGHPMEDNLTEAGRREAIKSIINLYKSRGRRISWQVFYRMLGFTVNTIPLWKKDIYEEDEQYSTIRYVTSDVLGEILGTPGLTDYSGLLASPPIRPGSLRIQVDGKVFRDDGNRLSQNFGQLVTNDGSTGSINYATGRYQISLSSAATTNVVAEYATITNEFPYHAARVDLEVLFYLDDPLIGPLDTHFLERVLQRLEIVRPVHVVVRLVIFVLDIPETLDDFVTDGLRCGPSLGKDVRDTEYRMYAADLVCSGEDNGLLVETTGATTEKDLKADDLFIVATNPDLLKIEYSDGQPTEYW